MDFYIKTALLACVVTTITIANDGTSIFLENKYGTDIIYKEASAQAPSEEFTLNNETMIRLGSIGEVGQISVNAHRMGSGYQSSFKDLSSLISEIDMDSLVHPNKNAIITIQAVGSHERWKPVMKWQQHSPTRPKKRNKPQQQITLHDILHGSLGDDYAQKTKDLYEYDYTNVTQGGFVNLLNELLKEIENTNKQLYGQHSQRKGTWIAPERSTLEDLKNTIDRLHRVLQKYRIRDNQ